MTEFAEELKRNQMTLQEFCQLSGTPKSTTEKWYYGKVRTPNIVYTWLRLYQTAGKVEKNIKVKLKQYATSLLTKKEE